INVNEVLGTATEAGARVIAYGNEVTTEVSVHASGSLASIDTIGAAGATGATAGTSTSTTWLLPEGATHSGFTTFVDIVNPDLATDTQVNITCFPANSASKAAQGNPHTIPKGSRRTVNVNAACGPEADDMSTRVQVVPPPTPADSAKPNVVAGLVILNSSTSPADLAVGGSVGITTPQNNWVVAEGATHSGWHTFVLMANPGGSPVSATVTFLTKSEGQKAGPVVNIPAGSRRTIDVNVECGCSDDVSTLVTAPSAIAVESSITRIDSTGYVIADSVASGGADIAAASGTRWLAAEGASHSGLGTFILIANPNIANAASVDVTFLTKSSGAVTPGALQGLAIPAGSRVTIFVNNYVTDDVSTLVETNTAVKVVVEMSIDHITSQGFSKGRSLAFKLAA
ncbi:MAG: hypothetical protein ACRD1T_03685, partial [Acidimicrobiia bacterium]